MASIYSNNTGTVLANPFTAASDGTWFFYADNGTYDVTFSGTISPTVTQAAQSVIDPKFIGGTAYADTFAGADFCAKVAAAISAVNTFTGQGGTVDARGLVGSQTCSTNPFAGNVKGITLLMGSTIVVTDAEWVVPTANRIIGSGREVSLAFNTIIKASNVFPTSTPIITLGLFANAPQFGVQVTDLEMDCNGIAGCIGGDNQASQEQSWFRRDLAINAAGSGFQIGSSATPFGAQNSGPYEDLEVIPNTYGVTATTCIIVTLSPAFRGFSGITCNGDGYSSEPDSAIVFHGTSPGRIENVHIEHFINGIVLGSTMAGPPPFTDYAVADIIVENIEAGPDNQNTVVFLAGPDTDQNIVVMGVENSTMGGNTLVDNLNGNTIDNAVGLGFYAIGNGTAGAQTVYTSRNDIPINFQTNVTVLKNLKIPGTINSDASVSLNNLGTYNVFWHDSNTSGEPGPVIQTGNSANGHLCLLIQNTDAPSQGAPGGGACINGGGFNNLPGYAAIGAGYTGDMGTLIARSTALGGMFIQNGVFDFENQTGATVGMAASVTSKFRINTTGSAQFPTAIHFSSLGTPANGVFGYCDDCTPNVAPCTGSGTGAIAKRLNGAWDCR